MGPSRWWPWPWLSGWPWPWFMGAWIWRLPGLLLLCPLLLLLAPGLLWGVAGAPRPGWSSATLLTSRPPREILQCMGYCNTSSQEQEHLVR
ncbi:hypothetical protein GUJ93_ZPchr0007g5711 [Zizania palustris]|uniref:Uncharacterized protein n=1 Tax=Zizania palustris TaxID=103762 RepID=A0A8J5TF36_ZIZPA|nr:hypothetical protein GUJ93_ZPchr0007g5711 [Zizania palustris]